MTLTEARQTIEAIEAIAPMPDGPFKDVATYAEIIGWYVADLRQMMWSLNELSAAEQMVRRDEIVRLKTQVQQAINAIDVALAEVDK